MSILQHNIVAVINSYGPAESLRRENKKRISIENGLTSFPSRRFPFWVRVELFRWSVREVCIF